MNVDGGTSAAQVLEMLTSGEQHAECCICFDDLHERPCAAFMCKGKRTCPTSSITTAPASFSSRQGHVPTVHMRAPYVVEPSMPPVRRQRHQPIPRGGSSVCDVESNGKLSRADVIAILVSQFPIDHAKLEEVMPSLWERWDVDNSGYLTKDEVIGGDGAHFIS